MSLRIDTAEWISGALVIGNTGLGVRGDAIPSTGTHGPSILYNDVTLPGEAADEFRGLITAWPAGLSLFVGEDGGFVASGPDGAYSGTYTGYKNGAAYGSTSFTITIGSPISAAPGVATIALAGLAPAVRLAQNGQAGAGAVALTGYPPSLSSAGAILVAPGLANFVLDGYAPLVSVASLSSAAALRFDFPGESLFIRIT